MSSRTYYKFICALARLFYPKARTVYETPPDDEAGVFICNHSTIIGPVMMTLDFDRPHMNWIISCAMDKKHCESYAFHDVLSGESRKCKGFFRLPAWKKIQDLHARCTLRPRIGRSACGSHFFL